MCLCERSVLSQVDERRVMVDALGCEGVFEVGVDKGVELAVQDGVGVGCLVTRAQVFDLFVGVQHVTADLVAPLG